MADLLKNFFKKKVRDEKFKRAGKGHKLNEPSCSSVPKSTKDSVPKRVEPNAQAAAAGKAALARLESNKQPTVNLSQAAIHARRKRELEQEKKAILSNLHEESLKTGEGTSQPLSKIINSDKEEVDISNNFAVSGVYYKCSLISDEILEKEAWYDKIAEFFGTQLSDDELGLSACIIIHSCNDDKEKVNKCIETLTKYLNNIKNDPTEPKYWKIKMSNKVFLEKVKPIRGSIEFLKAAGFEDQSIVEASEMQDFLIWNHDNSDIENLSMLIDALHSTESVELKLDRDIKVLLPSQAAKNSEIPPSFFTLTTTDLVREQSERTKTVELSETLMTQATREKLNAGQVRKYKFTVIRIRFPDATILQGTFAVKETLKSVIDFVQEHLYDDIKCWHLQTATKELLTEKDNDMTLENLHLVPAVILTFRKDDNTETNNYLNTETLMFLQPM